MSRAPGDALRGYTPFGLFPVVRNGAMRPDLSLIYWHRQSFHVDFTNLNRQAGLSDAQLQGKLLRGGMGTRMPEFGSLYSDDDEWAVIVFVRAFMMGR